MTQKIKKTLISALLLFVGIFLLLYIFSLFIQPSDDGIIYLNGICTLILIVYITLVIILVWFPNVWITLKKFAKKLSIALFQMIHILIKIFNLHKEKNRMDTGEVQNKSEKEYNDQVKSIQKIEILNKEKDQDKNQKKQSEQVKLTQEIEILYREKRKLYSELKKLKESKNEINFQLEDKKRELGLLNSDNSEYIDNLRESNKKSMETYIEDLESEILHKQKILDSLNCEIDSMDECSSFEYKKSEKYFDYLDYLDSLDGIQFEQKCAELLILNGFVNVVVTQASNDYGIDIIAEKDNKKFGIQCKNYSSPVGNSSVQEAFAGKEYYKCDQAVVLTNNYFTDNAAILANKTHVLLWDREYLKDLIKSSIK